MEKKALRQNLRVSGGQLKPELAATSTRDIINQNRFKGLEPGSQPGAMANAAPTVNNLFTKSWTHDVTARPGKGAKKSNARSIAKS